MTAWKIAFTLGFLALIGIIYADVGPGPAPPAVYVYLVDSSGNPETSVGTITYHCMDAEDGMGGAVDPGTIDLACENGVCSNSGGWYYKFNPCFEFPYGYISYELNGEEKRTVEFTPEAGQSGYSLMFNAETGEQTSDNIPDKPPNECPIGFALLGLAFAACFMRE